MGMNLRYLSLAEPEIIRQTNLARKSLDFLDSVLLIENQSEFSGLTGEGIMEGLMERSEVFRDLLNRLCWRFMIMHLNGKNVLEVMQKLNTGLARYRKWFSFRENNCIGYKKNPKKNYGSDVKVKMSRELQKY